MSSEDMYYFSQLCNTVDTNNSSLEPQPSSRASGMERRSFESELTEGDGHERRMPPIAFSRGFNEFRTFADLRKESENGCGKTQETGTAVNGYHHINPFLNAVDGQKYLCVLGPPCLAGLKFRSVTIKQKQVPFNVNNFICRPALGCNEQQIEVEMTGFEGELFGHDFQHYRTQHCRRRCCRRSRGSCSSTSSVRSDSRATPNVPVKRSSPIGSRLSSSKMPSLQRVKLDHLKGTGRNRVAAQNAFPVRGAAPVKVALGRNNSNSSTKERPSPVEDLKWQGGVVHVQGDGRCLFRSLVVASHNKLQKCKRDEFGRPENDDEEEKEKDIADELRAKVVRFMKDNLHFYSQLENELINADQPSAGRYAKFLDRLEAMSLTHTMPGELELNAASCVLEQIIVVLNTDLEIISVYGDDRYPESRPLAVRFTRLGEDVGHYDAVILHNEQQCAFNNDCFRKVVHRLKKRVSMFNSLIDYVAGMDVDADMDTVETVRKPTDIDPGTDRFNQLLSARKFGTNNNKLDTVRKTGHNVQTSVSASTQTSETDCGARVEKRPVRRRYQRKPAKKSNRKRRTGRARKRKPKKRVCDRNYNRRSSRTRLKRARSTSSDVSCERQRKYRKTAVTTRKSKPFARSNRAAKLKRGRKSYARKTKRRIQVRKAPTRYFLVNPPERSGKDASELDINRPKPSHLPDAFAGGIVRCFMCQKCVDNDTSSKLLKCYLCGRFAHRECAVRDSPAWGHGQVDDNYFLCNECVPN